MARTWLLCAMGLGLGGCGAVPLALVPSPLAIVVVPVAPPESTLDGRWVIADEFGDQFCITIQERRISILSEGCLTDGQGFAVGFDETPRATVADLWLVITTTYKPRLFDDTEVKLTFSGQRQLDGSYVGQLLTEETTIEEVGGEEFVVETVSERDAVLTRD